MGIDDHDRRSTGFERRRRRHGANAAYFKVEAGQVRKTLPGYD
jgi:hypothetical protein